MLSLIFISTLWICYYPPVAAMIHQGRYLLSRPTLIHLPMYRSRTTVYYFKSQQAAHRRHLTASFALNLVPLSEINNLFDTACNNTGRAPLLSYADIPCIDEYGRLLSDDDEDQHYGLAIAEEDDLPDISKLTVDAFGADAITLSSDLSAWERSLFQPSLNVWNTFGNTVAFAEVLSGLRKRTAWYRIRNQDGSSSVPRSKRDLLYPPLVTNNEKEANIIAAQSSIILALARPYYCEDESHSDAIKIDAVATVELRLQPTDAKIPFTEPWFDGIERNVAKVLRIQNLKSQSIKKSQYLQPYLSNLCVKEPFRGRKLGRALVRVVENIARDSWGYKKMYLHVDLQNIEALNLYKSEGYRDTGVRWNPFWAGKVADIGYLVKNLSID